MEAKTTRCHSIQTAEVTCSKAISDAEAQKTSQAVVFQEEHSKYLQSLEEQAFEKESRSHHEVLSSCQAALYHSQQPLRELWLPCTITSTHSAPKDSLCRRTAIYSHFSHTNAQTVSKTEKAVSFARSDGEHAHGQSHPGGYVGGPPSTKK